MVISRKLIRIILVITIVFLFVSIPNKAYARWTDRSDELPGMDENAILNGILIGAAVVGCILFISIIAKNSRQKDKKEDSDLEIQSTDTVKLYHLKKIIDPYNLDNTNILGFK